MKIIVDGHTYEVNNFEGDETQTIQFIHKSVRNGNLVTVKNGTTNEEILSILIDRMKFLNLTVPCRENSIVITKLEEALMWLEKRTSDRLKRGVESTNKI